MNITGGSMEPVDDTVPPFPDEARLVGWRDITESALVGIRVLRALDTPSGDVYATLIQREALWDAVLVATTSDVWQTVLAPAEVAPTLGNIAARGLPR